MLEKYHKNIKKTDFYEIRLAIILLNCNTEDELLRLKAETKTKQKILFAMFFIISPSENIKKVSLVALFQTVIQYIFFYVGLANTSGVKGTIASGSNAFFAMLIASLIFKQEKLTFKKIIA